MEKCKFTFNKNFTNQIIEWKKKLFLAKIMNEKRYSVYASETATQQLTL